MKPILKPLTILLTVPLLIGQAQARAGLDGDASKTHASGKKPCPPKTPVKPPEPVKKPCPPKPPSAPKPLVNPPKTTPASPVTLAEPVAPVVGGGAGAGTAVAPSAMAPAPVTGTDPATPVAPAAPAAPADSGQSPQADAPAVPPQQSQPKTQLKAKLEPFFYIDFDWGAWTVNLTPHSATKQADQYVKQDYNPNNDTLVYGDYKDGFQKTSYAQIEGGLGPQVSFWLANTSGIATQFWAYVGVMPVVGKQASSVRFANTLSEAQTQPGITSVPHQASDIVQWHEGDNVTLISKGGVMFAAAAGLNAFSVGTARIAEGSWETYVEKIRGNRAYVKMTKGQLTNLSGFAGAALYNVSLNEFKNTDDGFSFLYDLNTEVGRHAYEDVVKGNVFSSQQLATKKKSESGPVTKVESFRSVNSGKNVSHSFGIPILWNTSYTSGKIQSYTSSTFHMDNTSVQVNYGIYSRENNYRFWDIHHTTDYMFTGAMYAIRDNSDRSVTRGIFGRYSYAYKNEEATNFGFRRAIQNLIRQTGETDLMVNIPTVNLGYTGIEFNVTLSEANTYNLMAYANGFQDVFSPLAQQYLDQYNAQGTDPLWYCNLDDRTEKTDPNCLYRVKSQTLNAAKTMNEALKKMAETQNTDAKAFSAAYAQFGEAMGTNMFTFRTALQLAGAGAKIDYLLEGTKFSMYYKSWETTSTPNRWAVTSNASASGKKQIPFDPKTLRSKTRGFLFAPGNGKGQRPGMPVL
jgi:hypothetical protein